MKKSNISIFVPHLGCPNQCSFCNQHTITGQESAPSAQDVKNAVEKSLESGSYRCELAFFGGSFTAIERGYMMELLESASEYVKNKSIEGIRISTRPDCITPEILSLLKNYGVTSIELGAQSMSDDVLEKNRRGHTSKQVEKAASLVKNGGFELGLQMMTGLYGDTEEKCINTAKKFISLGCDTCRIYPAVVLKGTYLEKLMNDGVFIPWGVEKSVEICAVLYEMLENAGVKVLRTGLHSSAGVKENAVGGAYHEAFGELVSSKIFYNKITQNPPGQYTAEINKKSLSKLLGQKKSNIELLCKKGYKINIVYCDDIKTNELRITKCC